MTLLNSLMKRRAAVFAAAPVNDNSHVSHLQSRRLETRTTINLYVTRNRRLCFNLSNRLNSVLPIKITVQKD
jgi:hypothetical protein